MFWFGVSVCGWLQGRMKWVNFWWLQWLPAWNIKVINRMIDSGLKEPVSWFLQCLTCSIPGTTNTQLEIIAPWRTLSSGRIPKTNHALPHAWMLSMSRVCSRRKIKNFVERNESMRYEMQHCSRFLSNSFLTPNRIFSEGHSKGLKRHDLRQLRSLKHSGRTSEKRRAQVNVIIWVSLRPTV